MLYWILVALVTMVTAAQAESGIASTYSSREASGGRTACGPRLRDSGYTVAHRSLPCGTRVRVTNRSNGKSVVATVTDRGPFIRSRIVDMTLASARAIGFSGLAHVSVERAR